MKAKKKKNHDMQFGDLEDGLVVYISLLFLYLLILSHHVCFCLLKSGQIPSLLLKLSFILYKNVYFFSRYVRLENMLWDSDALVGEAIGEYGRWDLGVEFYLQFDAIILGKKVAA